VNNYNYLNKNYEIALSYFSRIAQKYPGHAFAHYYTSMCHKNLGDEGKAEVDLKEFEKIISTDEFWQKYAIEFKLDKIYAKK
jgi:hypothetical protein